MQVDFKFKINDFVILKSPKEIWGNFVGLVVSRVVVEDSGGIQIQYIVRMLNSVASLVHFNEIELKKYKAPEPKATD